jgi:hypothetical protein
MSGRVPLDIKNRRYVYFSGKTNDNSFGGWTFAMPSRRAGEV